MKQVHARIKDWVSVELKKYAAKEDITMQDVFSELLEAKAKEVSGNIQWPDVSDIANVLIMAVREMSMRPIDAKDRDTRVAIKQIYDMSKLSQEYIEKIVEKECVNGVV